MLHNFQENDKEIPRSPIRTSKRPLFKVGSTPPSVKKLRRHISDTPTEHYDDEALQVATSQEQDEDGTSRDKDEDGMISVRKLPDIKPFWDGAKRRLPQKM